MSAIVSDAKFGKNLRDAQFGHHSSSFIRLNNGSFGACPAVSVPIAV
jgi:hypothetical protein